MRQKEHHPRISAGLFFIVLGLVLLVATNDLLHLGSVASYFTWQTVLIFIGILLLVNLNFTGGIILIALGTWFLLDQIYVDIPSYKKTLFWPAVIITLGISFIISSLFKKHNKNINQ